MPRRPALGTIAINNFYNQNAKQASAVAAAASAESALADSSNSGGLKTSIRTLASHAASVNNKLSSLSVSGGDENAAVVVVSNNKSNKQCQNYDDYEIYTDESTATNDSRVKSVRFVDDDQDDDQVEDVELRSQSSSSVEVLPSSNNKENKSKLASPDIDSEDDDNDSDDTCNDQDDEFDDSDNEVSDLDEYYEEDYDVEEREQHASSSHSNIDDSDEEEDEEEEPIIRLPTQQSVASADTSIMSVNLAMSPIMMSCDDHNRFNLSNEEEEEQEEEENRVIDEYDRKMRHEENVLFNLIDYRQDCLEYMRHLELELRPDPSYMRKQVDITSNMRAVLVDWLVDVVEEYKLTRETLFLSVNYLDRFLSKMGVPRNKLQLLGITSLYIASKCEELMPPGVKEFTYITDNTYSNKQLIRLEQLVLPTLGYRVNQPTVSWFLDFHFKSISQLTSGLGLPHNRPHLQRIKCLAHYLAELTLLDSDTYLSCLPSQIAAAALLLAMHTFGKQWTRQLAELVGYELTDHQLKSCILDLHKTFRDAHSADFVYNAINTRYKTDEMFQTSLVTPPLSLPFYSSK